MSSEKPHCPENTNQFKHNVELVYTVSSKLTLTINITTSKGIQHVYILCTLNTIAALFSSPSVTPFIVFWLRNGTR